MRILSILLASLLFSVMVYAEDNLSLRVEMAVDSIDLSTGQRTPTGHVMQFTSAPGSLEQTMIEWYAYSHKLVCCEDEDSESLETMAQRIINMGRARQQIQ